MTREAMLRSLVNDVMRTWPAALEEAGIRRPNYALRRFSEVLERDGPEGLLAVLRHVAEISGTTGVATGWTAIAIDAQRPDLTFEAFIVVDEKAPYHGQFSPAGVRHIRRQVAELTPPPRRSGAA